MPISDDQRRRISAWLTQSGRSCPSCGAGASSLTVTSIDERLSPDAATASGIDTSHTAWIAKIQCAKCKFAEMQLVLDDVGLA